MLLLLPENKINTVELHYWLKGGEHSMDAFVQNRCELIFLNIAQEVAHSLKYEIFIETEAIGEGGIKRWFKVILKGENKNATITSAVIILLIGSVIITPIGSAIGKTAEILIEKIFDDKVDTALDKEKKLLEIENLKLDIQEKSIRIEKSRKIKKLKSNFYKELEKDTRILQFSIVLEDDFKNKRTNEYIIDATEFEKFKQVIRFKEEEEIYKLETIKKSLINYALKDSTDIQNATIEIIAPDFLPNSDNWKGIYNGQLIIFKIESSEFNRRVQSGNIQFKKGTTIKCSLSVKRESSRTAKYVVLDVNNYLE